jgi:hypothetical protein
MLRRTVLSAALVAAVAASSGAASTLRPPPGTPDPQAMVLTSTDLGGAKVTRQSYFKDRDFPSVISYVRELEDGSSGKNALPYVESQAEVGTSVATTARFVVALRALFGTKEIRKVLAETLRKELDNVLVTNIVVGRPRALGVGPGSFDVLVTARLLGRRIDLHTAVFGVERVLNTLTVVGDLGDRVPLSLMTRLARRMGLRTAIELVPQNLTAPTVVGTPAIGQTLTATPGRWTGNPGTYTYQWQRCSTPGTSCAGLPAATSRTYVVADADVGSTLRVAVAARGALRGDPEPSAPTDVVAVFIDTFTGTSTSWSLGTQGAGPTIARVNGQLELAFPAGTSLGSGGFANAAATMNCRLPGDFDLQVDYRLLSGLLPAAGISVELAAFEFTGATFTGVHGVNVHNAGGNNHGVSTHFPDPGVFQPPYNDFVPDSAREGTLRLVRTTRGGVTTVTASRLHGSSWSFTSLPFAPPSSQAAGLDIFTSLAPFPYDVRVAFDNFRVSSGVLTCP